MSGDSEPIPESLVELLRGAIETEARLTLLLHLREHAAKGFTAVAVASVFYMSPSSAERDLALLCGRGFLAVTIGADLLYTYRPVTPDLDAQVTALARLWSERRVDVARVLRRIEPDPAAAFADAFRIRRVVKNGRGRDDG